jgi:hypothetical protein
VSELFESAGGVAFAGAAVVVIAFLAYWAFGPQAIGLPAIIGLLALWGLIAFLSDLGLGAVGIVFVLAGLLAVLLAIGIAIRLGGEPPGEAEPKTAGEEP